MPKETSQYEIIFNTRHPGLAVKDSGDDSIWKLIYNSYIGGIEYHDAGYLIRYPKESENNFIQRKKRSVYFNQMSAIVDMLSGMLFLNEPTRTVPKELNYFTENASKNKKINEFMRIYAAHTLMFTCGVLIDMPEFDPEKIKTVRDEIDNKLFPYSVMYLPFRIRDFHIGDDGNLDWVLLDDSYYEHSDPLKEGYYVTKYRLWTRNAFRDFIRDSEGIIVDKGETITGLNRVPFRFGSWRDDNNDFIGETIFEDIAMISKLIYNSMSYIDEMLASGTFKMLSYPTKNGELPAELTAGGLGPLSAIPYDGSFSNRPEFIGATLGDIDSCIKVLNFYMSEILKKVGLSTDETKEFVKSGAAKKIDFQKMRSLLEAGALMMEKTEEWMYETASLWTKNKYTIKCEYTSDYSNEELQQEVTMLNELMVYPVTSLKQNVLQVLVKKLLSNSLPPETIEQINNDIEKNIVVSELRQPLNTKNIANQIKNSQINEQVVE